MWILKAHQPQEVGAYSRRKSQVLFWTLMWMCWWAVRMGRSGSTQSVHLSLESAGR